MVTGALMNGIAGWLRFASASTSLQGEWAPDWLPYAVLLTGQCIAALAQPIFTNAPTAISAEWFATEERASTHCNALLTPTPTTVGA